jgi:hypothetical protein
MKRKYLYNIDLSVIIYEYLPVVKKPFGLCTLLCLQVKKLIYLGPADRSYLYSWIICVYWAKYGLIND